MTDEMMNSVSLGGGGEQDICPLQYKAVKDGFKCCTAPTLFISPVLRCCTVGKELTDTEVMYTCTHPTTNAGVSKHYVLQRQLITKGANRHLLGAMTKMQLVQVALGLLALEYLRCNKTTAIEGSTSGEMLKQ